MQPTAGKPALYYATRKGAFVAAILELLAAKKGLAVAQTLRVSAAAQAQSALDDASALANYHDALVFEKAAVQRARIAEAVLKSQRAAFLTSHPTFVLLPRAGAMVRASVCAVPFFSKTQKAA
jgi:hypothetical protein